MAQIPNSLKNYSLDWITANLDYFIPQPCDDWHSGKRLPICSRYFGSQNERKTILSNLPLSLADDILQHFLKQKCSERDGNFGKFGQLTNQFAHLLSRRTFFINLGNFMSFCPAAIQFEEIPDILQLIKARAPNIRSLTIESGRKTHFQFYFPFCGWEKVLSKDSLQAISAMKTLRTLRVYDHQILFSDLKQIAKQLPHLTHLDVDVAFKNSTELTDEMDDFDRSFSRVGVFLYRSFFNDIERQRELILGC